MKIRHYSNPKIPDGLSAVNYQLSDHFALKFDYSYWIMAKSTVVTEQSLGVHDIYQGAFSLVMGF